MLLRRSLYKFEAQASESALWPTCLRFERVLIAASPRYVGKVLTPSNSKRHRR